MYRVLDRHADMGPGTTFPPAQTVPNGPGRQNGDLYSYQAAAGIRWMFEWDASAGLWVFVGGPPLITEAPLGISLTGTSYASTGGPSVTVPLAGTYDIEHGAAFANAGTGIADISWLTVRLGGAGAADAEAIVFSHGPDTATQGSSLSRRMRRSGLAAGAALAHFGKTVNSQDSAAARWISALPVSVSP